MPPLCAAAAPCKAKRHQAFIFSMFPISAVTTSVSAPQHGLLALTRLQGLPHSGPRNMKCWCGISRSYRTCAIDGWKFFAFWTKPRKLFLFLQFWQCLLTPTSWHFARQQSDAVCMHQENTHVWVRKFGSRIGLYTTFNSPPPPPFFFLHQFFKKLKITMDVWKFRLDV